MKLTTSLRSGSFFWAAPFVVLLTLVYYVAGESGPLSAYHGFAPALVAAPLMTLYSLAYATAAGLAAWESGRLVSGGIWALAPARSRFRVAANALLPVVLLAWLVVVLPAALSLGRTGTLPTMDSLRLPAMAFVLCLAHAVIGFSVGLRVHRVIAAPVVAVGIWVLVSFSRAVQPYWLRHVSGQFMDLSFGEVPAASSLIAPLLFGCGVAAGIAVLWLPIRIRALRAATALAVAAACTYGGFHIARNWDHDPPLLTGRAPMTCQGTAPEVCMPRGVADVGEVRQDAVSVVDSLHGKGAIGIPALITDRLSDGRFPRPSTASTMRADLTTATEHGDVRYAVLTAAVHFPCAEVDLVNGHAALLWGATVTGQVTAYERRIGQEQQTPQMKEAETQVRKIVATVLARPDQEQGAWFRQTLRSACASPDTADRTSRPGAGQGGR
ncbi:hypothetical protein [Streptomyces sp. NPDC049040]|uniref:hypothetical protein n=1 Tax=Streptomyces sp. NPDC049040 TaxID=3365593 RepID=UPI0037247715